MVVSVDEFNSCPADLVVVVPITSKNKNIPLHVEIQPKVSGIHVVSARSESILFRCSWKIYNIDLRKKLKGF